MPLTLAMKVAKSVRFAPEVIPRETQMFLHEAGALIEKSVRQRTPQGVCGTQSGARASIFAETRQSAGLFSEVIGSNLAYIEPLEVGRRPGKQPPVDALIPWVEKFIALDEGETAEGVAFVIARAIGRRGTQGAHMFEQGLNAALPLLPGMAERMGLKMAQGLVKPGGAR